MRQAKSSRSLSVALLVAPALLVGIPAQGGGEATASKSLTVQTAGVRGGKPGENYFNIEGRSNGDGGKYAGFGVLIFPATEFKGSDIKTGELSLILVQSLAPFSRDGKVKFFLAMSAFDTAGLKFDPGGTDGLGDQVGSKRPLGKGEFKKGKTGQADTFALTVDAAARTELSDHLSKGKEVRVLVVPDDDEVAATYFGTGQEDETKRPRLKVTPAR